MKKGNTWPYISVELNFFLSPEMIFTLYEVEAIETDSTVKQTSKIKPKRGKFSWGSENAAKYAKNVFPLRKLLQRHWEN